MAITPTQWSHVLTIPESYTPSSATSGQTLVITESVIAKLSSGDQATFWANVQNGGGDVRICTDSAGSNQLPIEIVSLDNVAQTCVIWTRKPTYDGAGDLFVFIGKPSETQPAVTDPFGRNAVWADFSLIIHEGSTVDSTGNHAPVLNGSPSLSAGVFGSGYDLQLGTQYIKIPDSSDISFSGKSSYCVDVWSVIPALVAPAQMLVDKSYTSNNSEARLFKQNGGNSRHRNPSLSPPNLDTADTYGKVRDSFIFNEGVKRTLSNDTQTGSGSVSGSISRSSDDLTIGSDRKDEATGGALPLKGVISDVWIQFNSIRNDDVRSTEYENQSGPASFFGTPTIAETGGAAGVTVDITESAADFSESSILSITANITAQITESLSDFSESSAASFAATLSAQVTEVNASFTESSSATITNNIVSVSVTETSQDFSESASASISGSLAAIVTELSQSFTESSTADISANISAVVTELAQDFNESARVNLTSSFTVEVTETTSNFEDACYIQLPVQRLTPRKTISVSNRSGSTIRVRRRSSVIRVK